METHCFLLPSIKLHDVTPQKEEHNDEDFVYLETRRVSKT
jgi:hypothetical protein